MPMSAKPIKVEMSPGELIDRITILEIKSERMTDEAKLTHVRAELQTLVAARDAAVPRSPELADATARLKQLNESLWVVEDHLRDCERRNDFGPRFVELARAVYHTNDRRAAVKRRINDLLGSRLVEQKSYAAY